MTRFFLALAALAALTLGAYADGLPQGRGKSKVIDTPYKAPVTVATGYNWNGFYVGGGAGHQWYDLECSGGHCGDPSHSDSFWLGELKAGVDMRLGTSNFVLGAFGTWTPEFLTSKDGVDNIYSLGGRLGYIMPDSTLVYTGAAWVRAEGFDQSADGWAVLAGFEKPLFDSKALNLTWGVEYKYTDLGASVNDWDCDLTGHTVMARLSFRLGN